MPGPNNVLFQTGAGLQCNSFTAGEIAKRERGQIRKSPFLVLKPMADPNLPANAQYRNTGTLNHLPTPIHDHSNHFRRTAPNQWNLLQDLLG